MPNYCYLCNKCDEQREVTRPIVDCNLPEICSCGKRMRRDFKTEHFSARGDYSKKIISDSMAFDACDLAEHRKRFPDVEVQVDHSRSARPVFRSLTQRRRYMKQRGWIDTHSFF